MISCTPPPHDVVFCPLLKRSKGHPFLKIRDFPQSFVADAPMKKKSLNLVLPPLRELVILVDETH